MSKARQVWHDPLKTVPPWNILMFYFSYKHANVKFVVNSSYYLMVTAILNYFYTSTEWFLPHFYLSESPSILWTQGIVIKSNKALEHAWCQEGIFWHLFLINGSKIWNNNKTSYPLFRYQVIKDVKGFFQYQVFHLSIQFVLWHSYLYSCSLVLAKLGHQLKMQKRKISSLVMFGKQR